MPSQHLVQWALTIGLTILSGIGDSQGFLYAARIWTEDGFHGPNMAKSGLGFGFGILMYWIALRGMRALGVVSPEVQTGIWFAVTIAGVALLSGRFLQWQPVDRLVAAGVLAGLGWIVVRTGG
jgi:hypothetical protein